MSNDLTEEISDIIGMNIEDATSYLQSKNYICDVDIDIDSLIIMNFNSNKVTMQLENGRVVKYRIG